MQIDFNIPFLNLDGTAVMEDNKVTLMSTGLANRLVYAKHADPMRLFEWARALWHIGKLDLDKSDQEILKTFLLGMDEQVFVKAQLIERFEDEILKSKKKREQPVAL